MSHFLDTVHAALREMEVEPGAPLLVGVSGGMDSVSLLHALHRLGHAVTVVHVNYGRRGAASVADEQLVRALAEDMACRCHVVTYKPSASTGSFQAEARAFRYRLFGELAHEHELSWVAVGHTASDQAETLLLNAGRGTGPRGLWGMPGSRLLVPHERPRLIRPLLTLTRTEVEAFAKQEGLQWRHDASNDSDQYLRNRVRHELLPVLRDLFGPGVEERLAWAAATLQAQGQRLNTQWLTPWFEAHTQATDLGGQVALDALQIVPPLEQGTILLEAVRRWLPGVPLSREAAGALGALVHAQVGRRRSWPAGTVWRERTHLVFQRSAPRGGSAWLEPQVLEETVPLPTRIGALVVQPCPMPKDPTASGPYRVYVDLDALAGPLWVRPWRPGDVLRPFGLNGTKKVSDMLTDAKVPSHTRRDALVVGHADEVLWVVGLRRGQGALLTSATTRAACITFFPDRP